MRNSRIDVRPIAWAFGDEVQGVGIGQEFDDSTTAEIRQALNQYCVTFLRFSPTRTVKA